LTPDPFTEEIRHREQFLNEQGGFLPDDLCPFVGDQPLRWAIEAVGDETLPHIQESLLQEVSNGYISKNRH
jgi:autophagy-related protein 17